MNDVYPYLSRKISERLRALNGGEKLIFIAVFRYTSPIVVIQMMCPIWATKTLREFIVKGFVLDDERLKQGK